MIIFGQCINVLNYNANYKPNINFRAILLATSRHVVQITGRISRNNARLHLYLSSDYFRENETKSAEKRQFESFNFIYTEEKQTRSVESSTVIATLKSWSKMPFRKVEKSQQNMPSTSLKVKKVTSRLSNLVLRKLKLSHFIK